MTRPGARTAHGEWSGRRTPSNQHGRRVVPCRGEMWDSDAKERHGSSAVRGRLL